MFDASFDRHVDSSDANDVDTILIAETLFYMWHRLCRGCFVTNDILRMGRDSPISILCMPDQL
ncbi:hypothetical protein ISN44_As01g022410 [Arabidopsis suecica]|uniref:Uncharacterized protein n=1 Tax=Arabidopsis suecica TaxID=45249 RepID=A0A8T2H733_ARASU|nr:hypothetical protein ISN44_As01g022410 [Arabidopsis suecica]